MCLGAEPDPSKRHEHLATYFTRRWPQARCNVTIHFPWRSTEVTHSRNFSWPQNGCRSCLPLRELQADSQQVTYSSWSASIWHQMRIAFGGRRRCKCPFDWNFALSYRPAAVTGNTGLMRRGGSSKHARLHKRQQDKAPETAHLRSTSAGLDLYVCGIRRLRSRNFAVQHFPWTTRPLTNYVI